MEFCREVRRGNNVTRIRLTGCDDDNFFNVHPRSINNLGNVNCNKGQRYETVLPQLK